jgi:hypothetical protein
MNTSRYFHIGHQNANKTYGYIENTVYQLDKLLLADKSSVQGKIFYLGDTPPYSIEEWANEIANELNIKIKRCPLFVVKLAANNNFYHHHLFHQRSRHLFFTNFSSCEIIIISPISPFHATYS